MAEVSLENELLVFILPELLLLPKPLVLYWMTHVHGYTMQGGIGPVSNFNFGRFPVRSTHIFLFAETY